MDGLLRTPEVSWKRREVLLDQVLRVGEEVTVTVLEVDADGDWLTVSLKSLQGDPFREFARTYLGRVVSGRVTKVASIGVFVRVHQHVEGLLPASEVPEREGDDEPLAFGDALEPTVGEEAWADEETAVVRELLRLGLELWEQAVHGSGAD